MSCDSDSGSSDGSYGDISVTTPSSPCRSTTSQAATWLACRRSSDLSCRCSERLARHSARTPRTRAARAVQVVGEPTHDMVGSYPMPASRLAGQATQPPHAPCCSRCRRTGAVVPCRNGASTPSPSIHAPVSRDRTMYGYMQDPSAAARTNGLRLGQRRCFRRAAGPPFLSAPCTAPLRFASPWRGAMARLRGVRLRHAERAEFPYRRPRRDVLG
jgi:hypothetical protein